MITRVPITVVATALFLGAFALPSQALLIPDADASTNTRAPADDPGWRSVVSRKGRAAVYLGRGWVITAAHAGVGPVTIDGKAYRMLYGSARRLRNADSSASDLLLYRIVGEPDLPVMPIATSTPEIGTPVVLISAGHDRGVPIPRASEGGDEPPRGWRWAITRHKRWGVNTIHENRYEFSTVATSTRTLALRFDPQAGAGGEAHAIAGDSGGALFAKRDGVWELVGVLLASSGRIPAATLIGDLSLAGNLASYRDQILAATAIPDLAKGKGRWLRKLRSRWSGIFSRLPKSFRR